MSEPILNKLPEQQRNIVNLATNLSHFEMISSEKGDLNLKSAIYQDALTRLYRLQDKCAMLKRQAENGCTNSELMLETMSPVQELCVADVIGAAEDFIKDHHSNVSMFKKS